MKKQRVNALEHNEERSSNNDIETKKVLKFPIVCIGASAGGLSAFETFFSGMPTDRDSGIAFILIQHLSPEHKSMLPELIGHYTKMEVLEIEDATIVLPNKVYIIPPNKDISIFNGKIQLLEISTHNGLHLPIDSFLRSLAQDQGSHAIAIILSGTGSDGTLGVPIIKGEGGMVMVQDPITADYNGMPCSAIATGIVDFIVAPNEMAEKLIAYSTQAFDRNKLIPYLPIPEIENAMDKIFVLLRSRTGHDFSMYKRSTISRRIERRMAVNQIENVNEYVLYLQKNQKEIDALFRDMLIGVTNFFRDIAAFIILKEKAIEKLCMTKSTKETIRVWVPGCSSGEEAYSIAILFHEKMEELHKNFQIQIFATDIDSQALAVARAGNYPASISTDILPERLERYFDFNKDGSDTYRIKKIIRDMLIFSEQNYTKDPPFSKVDLISCRNSLIYMTSELQKKIFPIFHYSLNLEGFLFLGNSESVGDFLELFDEVDRKAKLFQKKAGYSSETLTNVGSFINHMPKEVNVITKQIDNTLDRRVVIKELGEQSIIRQYAPAFVIIDNQKNVLYVYGRTGRYLEPAQGEGNLNILNMAREGLKQELTTALHKVISVNVGNIMVENLRVKTNGDFSNVNRKIQKLDSGLYLVIFEEPLPQIPINTANQEITTKYSDSDNKLGLDELRNELMKKDDYIQSMHEEMKTSNEELSSANEEMQSVNEELQSTNEELETSKEELQSLNEELNTVNNELQLKLADLSQVNNDMNNLMSSTGVGTIFVDHQLNIQRYTPNATKVVNLIKSDIGRPLEHIVSNLIDYNKLIEDTQSVLDTLIPKEIEVRSKTGIWYLMRILPYRTILNVIEGAVLTFVDITEIKKSHDILRDNESLRHLAIVVRDAFDAIIVQNLQGEIIAWNPSAERLYGWSEAEALKMSIGSIIPKDFRERELKVITELSNSKILEPYHTQRIAKDGKTIEVQLTVTALIDKNSRIYAITTTERKFHSKDE